MAHGNAQVSATGGRLLPRGGARPAYREASRVEISLSPTVSLSVNEINYPAAPKATLYVGLSDRALGVPAGDAAALGGAWHASPK